MNIYKIEQDFDNYKFFVFKKDDELHKNRLNFKGQSLANEWKGFSLELFNDKRKKKEMAGSLAESVLSFFLHFSVFLICSYCFCSYHFGFCCFCFFTQ